MKSKNLDVQKLRQAQTNYSQLPSDKNFDLVYLEVVRLYRIEFEAFARGLGFNYIYSELIVEAALRNFYNCKGGKAMEKPDSNLHAYIKTSILNLSKKFPHQLNKVKTWVEYSEKLEGNAYQPETLFAEMIRVLPDLTLHRLRQFLVDEKSVLTLPQWNLFKLKAVDGLDYRSIAEELGVKPDSAKSHFYKIKVIIKSESCKKLITQFLRSIEGETFS